MAQLTSPGSPLQGFAQFLMQLNAQKQQQELQKEQLKLRQQEVKIAEQEAQSQIALQQQQLQMAQAQQQAQQQAAIADRSILLQQAANDPQIRALVDSALQAQGNLNIPLPFGKSAQIPAQAFGDQGLNPLAASQLLTRGSQLRESNAKIAQAEAATAREKYLLDYDRDTEDLRTKAAELGNARLQSAINLDRAQINKLNAEATEIGKEREDLNRRFALQHAASLEEKYIEAVNTYGDPRVASLFVYGTPRPPTRKELIQQITADVTADIGDTPEPGSEARLEAARRARALQAIGFSPQKVLFVDQAFAQNVSPTQILEQAKQGAKEGILDKGDPERVLTYMATAYPENEEVKRLLEEIRKEDPSIWKRIGALLRTVGVAGTPGQTGTFSLGIGSTLTEMERKNAANTGGIGILNAPQGRGTHGLGWFNTFLPTSATT